MFRSIAVVAILLIATSNALAGVISMSAFSGREAVIDFAEIQPSESLRLQFHPEGVHFDLGLYGDPFPGTSIQGNREVTNFTSISNITNPIVARFDFPQRRVGFLVAGVPPDDLHVLVEAFRGSDVVEKALFLADTVLPGGTLPSTFVGIESARGIDRLEVSNPTGIGGLSLDDLRFEPLVHAPSPSTISLMSVAVLAWPHRRRLSPRRT